MLKKEKMMPEESRKIEFEQGYNQFPRGSLPTLFQLVDSERSSKQNKNKRLAFGMVSNSSQ